jgi:hypothetical protein
MSVFMIQTSSIYNSHLKINLRPYIHMVKIVFKLNEILKIITYYHTSQVELIIENRLAMRSSAKSLYIHS